MQRIPLNTWHRSTIYNFYKEQDSPHFGICSDLDVTALRKFAKKHNFSFFLSTVYCISRVVQTIPELRYRIRNRDEVILHDLIHPSFTTPALGSLFSFCTLPYSPLLSSFVENGNRETHRLQQLTPQLTEAPRDDVIYMTCLPWVRFTSFHFAMHEAKKDSIPRFAWGKVETRLQCSQMPLAVQLHHGLADGRHLGLFYESLQELISEPEKNL